MIIFVYTQKTFSNSLYSTTTITMKPFHTLIILFCYDPGICDCNNSFIGMSVNIFGPKSCAPGACVLNLYIHTNCITYSFNIDVTNAMTANMLKHHKSGKKT